MRDFKILSGIYLTAFLIRYGLIHSAYKNQIENRVEVSTPVNSFSRVIESVYRTNLEVDLYSSGLLHETPIHAYVYKTLLEIFWNHLDFLYIFVDILTAHLLYMFTKRYMLKLYICQSQNEECYDKSASKLFTKEKDYIVPPIYAVVVYLFNPYGILNCIGYTTTCFVNLSMALFFVGLVYGNVVLSMFMLILCTTQSFYVIILLSPLFLMVKTVKSLKAAYISLVVFFVGLIGCFCVCQQISGNWDFLQHTYGFMWSVYDQQPNIGVFWYFFMEMFEHFRMLFIFSYQMNVLLLYFIPLTMTFQKDPVLLATCFYAIITIFKSYPSIGDTAFILGLLPCWKHLYMCMQQIFISGVAIVLTTVLAPVLWDLWIFWGSANANFYFGATLAFITAQIFFLTDLAFAYVKRDFLLLNGTKRTLGGKVAKLVLQ